MDLTEAIRASYLAQGLSDSELQSLYSLAECRTFDEGAEIVRQFDKSRDLMILISGSALILTVVGEPIGWVKPGMPIGEVSFLDGRPRSGTVMAKVSCDVVVFPFEPLMRLLNASPALSARCLWNVSKVLCSRLRLANQHIAALMAIEESELNLTKG